MGRSNDQLVIVFQQKRPLRSVWEKRQVSYGNILDHAHLLTEGGLSITALDGVFALLLERSNLLLRDSFYHGHFIDVEL